MKLIVGLGNPGKQYVKTRHNIGFMVLDALREKLNAPHWELSKKFNAEICGIEKATQKIILAKPMTFMNESGQTVHLITHFYKMKEGDLIVVHDDKDIKLGYIKIQTGHSSAGHNGVQSIIDHLGTQKFTRVRIGVASENPKKMLDTGDFVLGRFGLLERKKVEEVIKKSVAEILKILK